MTAASEAVDVADVLAIARQVLGDQLPVRDVGLLGAAVARPWTVADGDDVYPTIHSKAAALLESIMATRPLDDGNDRLGWFACAVLLELNGASVAGARPDDVGKLLDDIGHGRVELTEIARRLEVLGRRRWRP
jgi:death-on-curing protein